MVKSTGHKNCKISKRGKKLQLKIGQNVQKHVTIQTLLLNEAQVQNIKINLAHVWTKLKYWFSQKKFFPSKCRCCVSKAMTQENWSQIFTGFFVSDLFDSDRPGFQTFPACGLRD